MTWEMISYEQDTSSVLLNDNENGKMLGPHVLGILLFLHDSTDAYTTRQGNAHYIYHNVVVTVVILNGCLTSIAPREYSPD